MIVLRKCRFEGKDFGCSGDLMAVLWSIVEIRNVSQKRQARKAKQNAVLIRTLFSLSVALGLGELGPFAARLGRLLDIVAQKNRRTIGCPELAQISCPSGGAKANSGPNTIG